jgi:hypothetical protein
MPAIAERSNTGRAVRKGAFGLLVVGAVALNACIINGHDGPVQDDPAAFSWNAPVSAPATVFVRNTNGSVEVRPSTDGNVRVTADVKWHRGDPKKDLKFETKNGADGITICALWDGGQCSAAHYKSTADGVTKNLLNHGTDASVTFTVYVPTGVKVDAFTVNGSIGIAATAPVKAQTVNGSIKVATSVGPVDGETVNGSVDVRMTTLGGDGPVRAHAVTGSAVAYLPEKFDGSVDISSAIGGIKSDFPGTTSKDGDKKFTAVFGTGSRTIDIATVTGPAELHKLRADGTVAAP